MNLVTGATGHIGNVLVRELCNRGERVRALLLPGEPATPLTGLDVEIAQGDILDLDALRRAMQGVDVIYHLAGLITILPGKDERVRQVNVKGTQNVLQAAREAGVERLVYTSSIHAIKRLPEGCVIDETAPFDPIGIGSAYDSSKAEATLEVLRAASQGLPAVVVCPTGVIGPYDYRRSDMGQLILDTMNSKLQFTVEGAYDFVDVRDVALGLVQACQKGRAGEHYILSGERFSVSKLMSTVAELTGLRAVQVAVPIWLAKVGAMLATPLYRLAALRPRFTPYSLQTVTSNSHISHAKASRELGYAPRPVRQSLKDTIAWFKQNGHLLFAPPRLAPQPVRRRR
jgi:dihydroflavonol-4-reductase